MATRNGYFDNGATSYPKPPECAEYIARYLSECGGTYGRGSYERVLRATDMVERCRERMAEIMGVAEPASVTFGCNASFGVAVILRGFDFRHGRVLISPLEHNAVTRELEMLRQTMSLTVEVAEHSRDGAIDIPRLKAQNIDAYDMVIVCHQSNVNGLTQNLDGISEAVGGRAPLFVDMSQSLGHVEPRLDDRNVDFAIWTGHKGLLGPTGVGGCFIRNHEKVRPLVLGGTGSNSDSYEMPNRVPDKFEAGTPPLVPIAGLLGSLENRPENRHSRNDFHALLERCKAIKSLTVLCADDTAMQGELFSVVCDKMSVAMLNHRLWHEYAIECRSGLHCAPLAHKTLGSMPHGSVRISPSPYHTKEDFDALATALEEICR